MHRKTHWLWMVIVLAVAACSGLQGDPLTGAQIDAYLNAYRALRQKAPDMLNQANSGQLDTQKAGYQDFERVCKDNGLSYREFVVLNAKIGAIYSTLQAENFMGDMEKMKTDGLQQMDDGMAQLQAQIDNPDVPEESKVEMRKAIAEMKTAQQQVNTDYDKNKGWADLVMDKTKALTNVFVAKEDVELVRQYGDKITAAYTGGIVPTHFQVPE
jgi:hypothetical protein